MKAFKRAVMEVAREMLDDYDGEETSRDKIMAKAFRRAVMEIASAMMNGYEGKETSLDDIMVKAFGNAIMKVEREMLGDYWEKESPPDNNAKKKLWTDVNIEEEKRKKRKRHESKKKCKSNEIPQKGFLSKEYDWNIYIDNSKTINNYFNKNDETDQGNERENATDKKYGVNHRLSTLLSGDWEQILKILSGALSILSVFKLVLFEGGQICGLIRLEILHRWNFPLGKIIRLIVWLWLN